LLLENAGIVLQDAEKAQVTHMPKVPFVEERTDVQTQNPDSQTAPSQVPPPQP